MNLRGVPNIITGLRIALVVPLFGCLFNQRYGETLLLLAVAGASDGVDGYLARRNGWTSRLGAVLDPLADKVLMVSLYAALGWQGHLPAWLVGLVIGRDIVILAGALTYYLLFGRYRMAPTLISKLNTVFQILLVIITIFALAEFPVPGPVVQAMIALVALTTAWSGFNYVWVWSRRALGRRSEEIGGE